MYSIIPNFTAVKLATMLKKKDNMGKNVDADKKSRMGIGSQMRNLVKICFLISVVLGLEGFMGVRRVKE